MESRLSNARQSSGLVDCPRTFRVAVLSWNKCLINCSLEDISEALSSAGTLLTEHKFSLELTSVIHPYPLSKPDPWSPTREECFDEWSKRFLAKDVTQFNAIVIPLAFRPRDHISHQVGGLLSHLRKLNMPVGLMVGSEETGDEMVNEYLLQHELSGIHLDDYLLALSYGNKLSQQQKDALGALLTRSLVTESKQQANVAANTLNVDFFKADAPVTPTQISRSESNRKAFAERFFADASKTQDRKPMQRRESFSDFTFTR